MAQESLPTKIYLNRSQLLFHTMKTMLIQLQWSDFNFEETFEIVRQFSLKWKWSAGCQNLFFVLNVVYSQTILTRILSHNFNFLLHPNWATLHAMSDMTLWGMTREKKQNCNKSIRSNITISEHSQEIQELHISCKFLAFLCFELLDFETPRSYWT